MLIFLLELRSRHRQWRFSSSCRRCTESPEEWRRCERLQSPRKTGDAVKDSYSYPSFCQGDLDYRLSLLELYRYQLGPYYLPKKLLTHQNSRVILILKKLFLQLLHGFKLFHLVSHFQNSFCFWCTTLPSAVCKIFRLQWEFQWENDQNQ